MAPLIEQLKSKYRKKILCNIEGRISKKLLLKSLQSKYFWSELTLAELNSLLAWSDVCSVECSIRDIRYGDRFLKKQKK
jgi:hypothetical protein